MRGATEIKSYQSLYVCMYLHTRLYLIFSDPWIAVISASLNNLRNKRRGASIPGCSSAPISRRSRPRYSRTREPSRHFDAYRPIGGPLTPKRPACQRIGAVCIHTRGFTLSHAPYVVVCAIFSFRALYAVLTHSQWSQLWRTCLVFAASDRWFRQSKRRSKFPVERNFSVPRERERERPSDGPSALSASEGGRIRAPRLPRPRASRVTAEGLKGY